MHSSNTNTSTILKYLQISVLVGLILYLGKALFIPLCFGLLIALILLPVCRLLEERHWPRSLAIALSLLILFILSSMLVWILVLEAQAFNESLPAFMEKMESLVNEVQQWLVIHWGITLDMQSNWLENMMDNISKNVGSFLSGTISSTLGMFFSMFITPVFTALFLYNRATFVKALELLTGDVFKEKLYFILDSTIKTYFNYVKGMIVVYIIVGVLNSIGLLLLGIEHAILFGMLTAIMTIIPYVGIIISSLLPISIAWLSTDSIWYPIGVIAIFSFVQYLEANLIFPMVVGAQLKINTWASLIAIIIGGIIWGASGMVLSLPILGILKLVSDHIEEWKPFNVLISK
ncbi:AI-2E family transporter [Solitalea lacus]|uniref:AI-2E family transporter n=1 Tax=Solitalea lacus TaxID=2911172 RepID=UPI001EDB3AA0|nr:AI-2E family transporter [Solitalea lacus]UKJ05860.1 AI-2E family transporter [Solitalea lacus]